MSDNNKNDKSHRELFQNILLIGSALFLENLVPPNQLSEYEDFNLENSKKFFLLRLLSEVQKVGFVLERWNNFLDKDSEVENENSKSQIIH